MPRHRCFIYHGAPAKLSRALASIIAGRLRANYRCMYLNSPTMIAGLRGHLAAAGVDPAAAASRGALALSSDQSHLVNGVFDGQRILDLLSDTLRQALADGFAGLWASGDMLWEIGALSNVSKLLTYEVELEELMRQEPALCGICQYHRDSLPASAVKVALYTHRAAYCDETPLRSNPHYRDVAALRSRPEDAEAHLNSLLDSFLPGPSSPSGQA